LHSDSMTKKENLQILPINLSRTQANLLVN